MRISVLLESPRCLWILSIVLLFITDTARCDSSAKSKNGMPGKRKLPKDPLYITELDLENLYDEWEDSDDEKLPPDELPPGKRPAPMLQLPKEGESFSDNPEKFLMASKKGQTVMAFVSVAGNPTKEDTELLTQRWQVGLVNMHMKCERFVVADDRAIFVFEDGALAFEAKDFLVDQPEVKEYTIENRSWHGKGYPVEYPNANKSDKGESTKTTTAAAEKKDDHKKSNSRDEL